MIPGSANPLLLQSAVAAGGYQISRSLRFNQPDSPRLSRTPASASNRKAWTWAGWVKLSVPNTTNTFFGATSAANFYDASAQTVFSFYTDKIWLYEYNGTSIVFEKITTQVFRDFSAWYHVVVTHDSDNATAEDRIRLYVNGVRITTFSFSTNPSSGSQSYINTAIPHYISGPNNYFRGYLADIHFIDGQALDPTSFGEFDATTGVWVPKAYTGTYGTNGFHLDFADNASTTTIGYDAAGSNDWTANNLSVTAGAGNDSLVDSPTNYGTDTGVGGEVRGNYCTLNPLDKSADYTLRNGNLDFITDGANSWEMVRATFAVSSGKWYWEFTAGDNETSVGIAKANATLSDYIGSDANGWSYLYSGDKYNNSTDTAYGAAFTTNDVIGVAFDADAGSLYFYKNGTVQNSGTAAFTGLTSGPYFPGFSIRDAGSTSVVNFGQRPFAYTAPSGFKALNTANLPAPLVTKPSTAFDVKLYTGNGSTQTISGLAFSPDLVWIKGRSGATDHALYDTVRGVQQQLESNTTTDETTESTGLTAFNSDGFALGALAQANTSSATYAAWCWDESVSTGFDIVTYTGNGSARTIAHSLGVAPSMIIVKARTTASTDQGWPVYHSANTAAPATDYLLLNSTAATADLDTVWNDTAPTSSVFSVGTNALVNANNDTYVAYCFAPVAGYSAFGSYTGNGSTDGPFVYTGFRPRWVMIKESSASGNNWNIWDATRDSYNVTTNQLKASTSEAETTSTFADFTSNGFKIRTSEGGRNASSATHIYAAFAESPFNYSRAR
jgi:hypothetical protein